jgi:ParB family chromosome partitioning protein
MTISTAVTNLRVEALEAHALNVRRTLGDLSDLTRSIAAVGVLEPLVVLPANDAGRHRIVAGHRRHAAG